MSKRWITAPGSIMLGNMEGVASQGACIHRRFVRTECGNFVDMSCKQTLQPQCCNTALILIYVIAQMDQATIHVCLQNLILIPGCWRVINSIHNIYNGVYGLICESSQITDSRTARNHPNQCYKLAQRKILCVPTVHFPMQQSPYRWTHDSWNLANVLHNILITRVHKFPDHQF